MNQAPRMVQIIWSILYDPYWSSFVVYFDFKVVHVNTTACSDALVAKMLFANARLIIRCINDICDFPEYYIGFELNYL